MVMAIGSGNGMMMPMAFAYDLNNPNLWMAYWQRFRVIP
ncbi:hypothetical protein D082_15320 [Synechocystis sp. PCC 6714]|nr:hypothetical protein D082_15320 [Synechocystis sp. PCC 6714]